jgi:hypothetical protein
MKVVDIADEIFRELGSPTDLSIPAIGFWVRTNVGNLNNRIKTTYLVDSSTLEINDADAVEIGLNEGAILKKMYSVHHYDVKFRGVLGASSYDLVTMVKDRQSTVKKVNRNDIAKSFLQAKRDAIEELEKLTVSYISGQATPIQVAGDDTVDGASGGGSSTSVRSGL